MFKQILSLLVISFACSAYALLESCEEVGKLKADPQNCHNFYQCTHNGWAPLNCLNALYFNPEISVCDWPKPGTECGKDIDTNDDSGDGNQNQNAPSKLEACDIVGQLKADAENCENFYQCTHNGWAPLHCQSGLFFNSEINVCDWPKPGTKCGKDTNTDDHSGDHSEDDHSKLETCDIVGELKADSDNCENFYQCTHNGWEQLHCPSGLFFNSEISVCDWPKSGTKCGKNDHSGDHDDDGHSNRNPCNKIGQIKADTKHCDLYYQCSSCGWSLVSCESGLLFNPKTSVCDKAERVTCAKDGDLEPCDELGLLKADNKHCDLYYECTKCGWALVTCQSGSLFDSKTATCGKSDEATCAKDSDDEDDAKLEPCESVDELKSDSERCDHYYKCTKKGWGSLPCGTGLLFNSKTLACESADNVKCGKDNDDDHSGDNDNDNDHSGDQDHDDDTDKSLEPCEKVGAFKQDPKNCNRYYQCTTYGWQNMPCYDNLVFNPNKFICDYSFNFECEIAN